VRTAHPAPEVLSGSEVARLIAHAPSLRHKALFMLMYGAGLRVSEARNLHVGDILLGHLSLSSTARYTHLSEARRATLRSPLDVLDTEQGRVLG
jgi:site-specific recombinase XerD